MFHEHFGGRADVHDSVFDEIGAKCSAGASRSRILPYPDGRREHARMHVRPFFNGHRRKDHDAVGAEFIADFFRARQVDRHVGPQCLVVVDDEDSMPLAAAADVGAARCFQYAGAAIGDDQHVDSQVVSQPAVRRVDQVDGEADGPFVDRRQDLGDPRRQPLVVDPLAPTLTFT